MTVVRYIIDKTIELENKTYEKTEDVVPGAIEQGCVVAVYVDDKLVLVRPSNQKVIT